MGPMMRFFKCRGKDYSSL